MINLILNSQSDRLTKNECFFFREDEIELGPGQIHPRGYRLAADRHGELRLGLIITKGQLEVDVQEGRTIHSTESDNPPGQIQSKY